MSERTKKLPTSDMVAITVHDKADITFMLPRRSVKELLAFLQPYQTDNDQLISADEVFKDLYQKYGKIGATLRGCRARNDLTQAKLAEMLEIEQSHISQMEHGKRVIGKKMAQKLAKIFDTDYRLFL